MRSVQAVRALWFAIVAPLKIKETTSEAATAVLAVAVLVSVFIATSLQMQEAGDPRLHAESAAFSAKVGVVAGLPQQSAPASQPTYGQLFTSALGTNILRDMITIAMLAGASMLFVRFLTNEVTGYRPALAVVAASNSIAVLGAVVTTGMHLAFHTMRAGMHAGVFVNPVEMPFWFMFLQRIDLFQIWQYLVIGVGLVTWQGMHWKVGIVVGLTLWVCVLVVFFGGISLISWILSMALVT